ncbi:putative acetyl-hydrolase [Clostridium sp. CAG:590]|nr:alpha/beta hydrolase [Clostridium sp.]CCX85662.1 putative acetyl-hydrolase [Clostridium sp. CAG:590]
MEDRISIRGRTARKMVKVANHLPLPGGQSQAGQLRAKLYQRERMWECPEHLNLSVISMEHFTMELLSRKREMEDTENNTDDWKLPGIVLQLHGGGYYGRMHNTYRDMAGLYNEISKGYDVLSVDYRVAPEHPYPAALEDALAAYQWIMERGYPLEKLIVAGDSAGGGLALALCLYLRDHDIPLPAGIITMSAWTDLTKSGESYQENFDIDPIFGGTMDSLVYQEGYYKDSNPEIPYISPVNGDYHGFPPMLMQVGEYEMLLSDTKTVARHAMDAGVTVKEHIYPGMFHVFQMGLLLYPEAKEAWIEVGRFIRYLRKKEK